MFPFGSVTLKALAKLFGAFYGPLLYRPGASARRLFAANALEAAPRRRWLRCIIRPQQSFGKNRSIVKRQSQVRLAKALQQSVSEGR
jgi:hypothetical protein